MVQEAQTEDAKRVVLIDDEAEHNVVFYRKMARTHRVAHEISGVVQIVLAALIPIVSLLGAKGSTVLPVGNAADFFLAYGALIVALGGASIALARGADGFFKMQENWIRASLTISKLKGEQLLFRAKAGAYAAAQAAGQDPIALYAQNVRAIVDDEAQSWKLMLNAPNANS